MPFTGPFSPRKSAIAPLACSLASRRLATAFSASAAIPFALVYSASSVSSLPTVPRPSRTPATIALRSALTFCADTMIGAGVCRRRR